MVTVEAHDVRGDMKPLLRSTQSSMYLDGRDFPLTPFMPEPEVDFETNLGFILSCINHYLQTGERTANVLQHGARELFAKEGEVRPSTLRDYLLIERRCFSRNTEAWKSGIDRLENIIGQFPGWNAQVGLTVADRRKYSLLYVDEKRISRDDNRVFSVAVHMSRVFSWHMEHTNPTGGTEYVQDVDEADMLFSENYSRGQFSSPFLQTILRQGRGVGCTSNLIIHDLAYLDKVVLPNMGHLICFRVTARDDAKIVSSNLNLPQGVESAVSSLRNRECFVRFDEAADPFLMRTVETTLDLSPPTHEEIETFKERTRQELSSLGIDPASPATTKLTMEVTEPTPARTRKKAMSEKASVTFNHLNLLCAIEKTGFRGIMTVYQEVGVSPTRGRKLVQQAVDDELAGVHILCLPGRSGQRTTCFLRVAGRGMIGAPSRSGNGGDEHNAYSREYHHEWQARGLDVYIEKAIAHGGKFADLVHRFVNEDGVTHHIATELEISTSGFSNAYKDLREFDFVWLVYSTERFQEEIREIEREFPNDVHKRLFVTTFDKYLRDYLKWWERSHS